MIIILVQLFEIWRAFDINVLICDSKVLKIDINESYWHYILDKLVDRNYLSGIYVIDGYGELDWLR